METVEESFLQKITIPIPILEGDKSAEGFISHEKFKEIFNRFQIAYIPNANKSNAIRKGERTLAVSDLSTVFANLDEVDKETWTEETWDEKNTFPPGSFLVDQNDGDDVDPAEGAASKSHTTRGYCSFIVQHDKNSLEKILQRLPISELPLVRKEAVIDTDDVDEEENNCKSDHSSEDKQTNNSIQIDYGPGLWIFFGRNSKPSNTSTTESHSDLQGRGEHTDSIDHDGTFHYQWSGIKDWQFRPTQELLQTLMKSEGDGADLMIEKWMKYYKEIDDTKYEEEDDNGRNSESRPKHIRLDVRCEEGDILMVNTRLWWHSTTLPFQPKSKSSSSVAVPSVSYARDVYLCLSKRNERQGSNFTNLDGLYAANDIEQGTIVFRESELPDCELHRTKEDPNCEIVELEDGEGAIVSCRNIRAGEFFCILESEEEYEEEDDDAGEGDEE